MSTLEDVHVRISDLEEEIEKSRQVVKEAKSNLSMVDSKRRLS